MGNGKKITGIFIALVTGLGTATKYALSDITNSAPPLPFPDDTFGENAPNSLSTSFESPRLNRHVSDTDGNVISQSPWPPEQTDAMRKQLIKAFAQKSRDIAIPLFQPKSDEEREEHDRDLEKADAIGELAEIIAQQILNQNDQVVHDWFKAGLHNLRIRISDGDYSWISATEKPHTLHLYENFPTKAKIHQAIALINLQLQMYRNGTRASHDNTTSPVFAYDQYGKITFYKDVKRIPKTPEYEAHINSLGY